MNDLIKRINFAMQFNESEVVRSLVDDMQAEIELLTTINASLRSQNESLDDECARLEVENDSLSKPYVPFNEDEANKLLDDNGLPDVFAYDVAIIETAVIARYNEQRGVK